MFSQKSILSEVDLDPRQPHQGLPQNAPTGHLRTVQTHLRRSPPMRNDAGHSENQTHVHVSPDLYTVDLGVSRQNGQNRQRFRRSEHICLCAARTANLRGLTPRPNRSPQENLTGISHDMSDSSQLAAHNHKIECAYIIPIEISNIPYNRRSTHRTQHHHIRSGSFQHGSNQYGLYQQANPPYTHVHVHHTGKASTPNAWPSLPCSA